MEKEKNSEGDINLLEYLGVVWRRRWLVVLLVAAGSLVTAAISLYRADTYMAATVIKNQAKLLPV